MEVHRLEPSIVARIKSSITINSVTQCITELVLNSLDAKSTAVAVRLNFVTFRIQVVDNGDGITEKNLNLIGERYMTSKCNDLSQLESRCPYYGFRGETLASIINVSEIIEIVSKPKNSSETWSRKFTKTAGNNAISVKDRPSCGTTVTVEGFLYNLPLRKKRVIPEVEFTQIKRNIECLIIVHPNVSFSLRNDVTGDLILNSPKCGDVISSLKYLHPELSDDYSLIKVSKSKVTIKGLLFKELWENSGLQYIYVNKRPIKCSKMQAFIYNAFRKNKKHANQMFGLKSNEKIKHHIYVINIKCPYSSVDILPSSSKTVVEFKNWTVIFSCLEKLILSFLGTNKNPCKKNYVGSCKVKSVCGISQIHGVFRGYGVKRKIDSDNSKSPPQKMRKVNGTRTEKVNNVVIPQCSADIDESIERQISVPAKTKFSQFQNTQNVVSLKNTNHISEFSLVEVPQGSVDNDEFVKRHISVPAKTKLSQLRNTQNLVLLKNTNHISEFSCEHIGNNNKINEPNFLCPNDKDLQKRILPFNHISNVLRPLPVKVFNRKAQKMNSGMLNTNVSQVRDTNSSLTKFTNDENKGKNLIMDMFLKSTQVFNSDDETQNVAVVEQLDNFHGNKLVNDEYNKNGKNLIMDMFLKSTQVFNSGDKSGDTIFEEESKFILENNITTNVNGKSKTMSVSVNITKKMKKRCHANKKRHNTSKSIQTSLQKNMVEKCVQTSVFQKLNKHSNNAELAENYTLILSNSTNRIPKFRFVYRSPLNLHYSEHREQVSENNCKCSCHLRSDKIFNFSDYNGNKYAKRNSRNFLKSNIFNVPLGPVDTFENRYTKQKILRLMENEENPERDYFNVNSFKDQISAISKKPFQVIKTVNKSFNHFQNRYTKQNDLRLMENVENPDRDYFNLHSFKDQILSISKKPFQVKGTVNKSFYFGTNSYLSTTVNRVQSTEDCFNHFQNRYRKQNNLRLMGNVENPERDYLKVNSFRGHISRRQTPFQVNRTVNKSFYFSTSSYLPETVNKPECAENRFNNLNLKNKVHLNASLRIDRTFGDFNPPHQSTQINQLFSKEKDFQKCSSLFSKLIDQGTESALPSIIFSKSADEDYTTSDTNLLRNHYKNVQPFEDNKAANKMRKKRMEEKNNYSCHNAIPKITSTHKTKKTTEIEDELFITLSNRQKQAILENELNAEKPFLDQINLEWASQMAMCREKEEANQKSEVFLEEWIKKQNEFGCDFYINRKTGFATFHTPKPVSNDFKLDKRFDFMPKGLSPILKEIKQVDKSLSQNKKDKLENYILESHQNDLLTIKWQKYIKNNDTKAFFDEMYREKLNSLENCIPTTLHNKKHFSGLNNSVTFDKALFDNLTVIGQLDKKFIVVFEEVKHLIILFDQHAVHERIRLEDLLKGYSNAKLPSYRHKFVVFVPRNDLSLLKKHEEYLNFLGLHVQFFEDGINIVDIPLCLHNKFKDNEGSLNAVVQLLIKEIIDLINDTRGVTFKNFPQIIQTFLNLEACRGAIKFGDALSKIDCGRLLRKLSTCNLPFQCAHGRPTLVPLLTLNLTNPSTPKAMNLKNLGI